MPLISPVAPSKELHEIRPIPGTLKWTPDLAFKRDSPYNRTDMSTEKNESKQKEEVTGFGIPEEWENFVGRHRPFFDRFPNLRGSMHTAFIRTVTISQPVDRLVFYLGRLSVEDFFEILLLCGNGYGIGGLKILRGMYERTVTAWYLHLHPDEADDFLDYHWVARRKQIRAIKETLGEDVLPREKVAELEDQYQRIKERFMITDCKRCDTKRLNHTWTKLDFISMARKAGSIGKLIVPAYYQPIEHTHPTTGGMLARLRWDGDKVTFCEGPQREEADTTLMTAHNLLLSILDLQKEHFAVTNLEDQLQQCFQDFQEIWS